MLQIYWIKNTKYKNWKQEERPIKTRIKLTELQAEYEEFLKEIFDGALENRVYFADQNYENAGQISVREFQSLFNYNYLNATRLLNDEKQIIIFR